MWVFRPDHKVRGDKIRRCFSVLCRAGCTSGDLFGFQCPEQSAQGYSRHSDPEGLFSDLIVKIHKI